MSEIDKRAYEVASVSRLLDIHNDGEDGNRANDEYRHMTRQITKHVEEHGGSAKAKLVIEIEMAADSKGIDVTITSSSKTPAPPKTKSRYFVSDTGDVLTLQNPNRGSLFPGADLGRHRAGQPQ